MVAEYHVQLPLLMGPHLLPRAQVQLVQEVFELFDCPKAAGDVGTVRVREHGRRPGDFRQMLQLAGEILQVFRGEARVFERGIWGRGSLGVLALPLEGLELQLPEPDVGVGLLCCLLCDGGLGELLGQVVERGEAAEHRCAGLGLRARRGVEFLGWKSCHAIDNVRINI